MRELQGFELDGVSGGVEGEISMEVGVSGSGPFGMIRGTIRFGGGEGRPNNDARQAPSTGGSGGDEPAFTATAERPK